MSEETLLTPGALQEGKIESGIKRPKKALIPEMKKKVDEEWAKEIKEINILLKSGNSAFSRSNKK